MESTENDRGAGHEANACPQKNESQETISICLLRPDAACSQRGIGPVMGDGGYRKGYICTNPRKCNFQKSEGRAPDMSKRGRHISRIIDADLAEEARGIRARAAAIQSTVFADAVPFDAARFVTDVIGS